MFHLRNYSRLISKHGNKDYFKGKGGGILGSHTKHGAFLLDPEKSREFIVPDMTQCKFKPYVSHETMPLKDKTITVEKYIEEAILNK